MRKHGSVRVLRTIIYGANTVALSEETESNGENKPAPKDRKAHFYSTRGILDLVFPYPIVGRVILL